MPSEPMENVAVTVITGPLFVEILLEGEGGSEQRLVFPPEAAIDIGEMLIEGGEMIQRFSPSIN